jgi:hypothetical protein
MSIPNLNIKIFHHITEICALNCAKIRFFSLFYGSVLKICVNPVMLENVLLLNKNLFLFKQHLHLEFLNKGYVHSCLA